MVKQIRFRIATEKLDCCFVCPCANQAVDICQCNGLPIDNTKIPEHCPLEDAEE
jgi:hypothetical protein